MSGDIMKLIKFLIVFLTIFGFSVFAFGYLNEKEVITTIKEFYNRKPSELENNEYTKNIEESFVNIVDDFTADDKNDIMNIYYTVLNSGMNEFTFYCSNKYHTCIEDIEKINKDDRLMELNNFISVFNSFKSIKTTYSTNGKINLTINRVYSNADIEKINKELDKIENKIIKSNKDDRTNIKAIHDYIIKNTKYSEDNNNNYEFNNASTAKGVFFDGFATCNGYTDAAALLLDRLNIKNIRISGGSHIWNLVYLDGKWLHLDLTWDDPVNPQKKDILEYTYFLKSTKDMDDKHVFDKGIYKFAI